MWNALAVCNGFNIEGKMKQTIKNKNLFCLPWAQTILGTLLDGKPNFMALGWLTRVNYDPPMLGICVNKNNVSHAAILDTGEFSINVPCEEMIAVTDYVGIVSGKKVDKSDLFETFKGELKSAPMIHECPLSIECTLEKTIELPTNFLFIGIIQNIYSEEEYLTDGKPDYEKIRPFLLTMPDNNFWGIGESIGKAWSDGVKIKHERS